MESENCELFVGHLAVGNGKRKGRWSRQKRETVSRQENSVQMLVVLDYSIYYR